MSLGASTPTAVRDDKMRVDYVPLSEIVKWPRNPKKHDVAGIRASIEHYGYVQPMMFDETTQRIVAGHGRDKALTAMKEAGLPPPRRIRFRKSDSEWLVPVLRGVAFDSEEQAQGYVIADNRFVELGGWDPELLREAYAALPVEERGFTGFTDASLKALEEAGTRHVEFDAAPPGDFPTADENLSTEHSCPKCGYRWSGSSAPPKDDKQK